ncbi:MAG: hypothetical protein AABX33_02530, partial [Nanoarchaeota archaeon]
ADLSGSLRGRHNLYNHLEYLLLKAKNKVLIFATQNEFINLTKRFNSLFKRLKHKNINIKILTQINKQTEKYVYEIEQFAEVKHTNNKARFCIVDSKEVFFMTLGDTDAHPTYDAGIWVNAPLAKDLENVC